MASEFENRGKIVVAAGTGINLALGVLYTWSIFKGAIRDSIETGGADAFHWSLSSLNDPYAVCCLVFASTMILAGKSQDTFGPRRTAIIGGILVGLGFILISQTTAYAGWILGFGVLVGAGIAFGYSSATPPAMKWFPPTQTGRVAGLVVAGFGLASVYIAPLAKYLLATWGLQQAMLFFGIAFLLVVSLLATFLVNPPEGFVPKGSDRRSSSDENKENRARFKEVNIAPSEMMRTGNFWLLWMLYFIGAGAGLMVISSVAGMAKQSLGEAAFWAVAVLAVGNAAGRIVAGILSDKIGGKKTLAALFAFQALLMFLAMPVMQAETASIVMLLFLTTFIGFNYGANLAIFPSFTKDLWGIKNFGVNYGIIFTSWGVGGFVMSRVSQVLNASTQTYSASFLTAGILLAAGVALSFLIHNEKEILRREIIRGEKPLTTH
ncbi:MAG: OFA family MFS transporter [Candidatus Thiodiazotropha sp. (ex Epidulcina cf. delphinae)]|nr:OFA family MFS transporter [Candidatus Thiodiazotropha sp. (ex Epidulcina cf. delphinae)]